MCRRARLSIYCALGFLVLAVGVRGAELRTWRAASGGFTTEAEFVELRDDTTVRLRMKDGSERDIPLDKLSAEDQAFARQQAAKPASASKIATPSKAGLSKRVTKLEGDVSHARTAEEALRLYRVFESDPDTTDAERQMIAERTAKMREMAEKHMVRSGTKWVAEHDFLWTREQATALLREALNLFNVNQEDAFRKKIIEAAKLEPDDTRAEFSMGLAYGYLRNNQVKAEQAFETCLRHDPDNPRILNNLALSEMKRGALKEAAVHWAAALASNPQAGIVHNVGRAIDRIGKNKMTAPKATVNLLNDTYGKVLGTGKFGATDVEWGWLYSVPENDPLSSQMERSKTTQRPVVPTAAEDGSEVIGGGTGWVVAPGYVMTNSFVVEGGTSFDVQLSDPKNTKLLKATLVASTQKPDLAILQCQGLTAPPLPLATELASRGTEIMTAGFPEIFRLGAALNNTRGSIAALPTALDEGYLYDAATSQGNAGSPVCDARGNVLAVHTVSNLTKGKYGAGIPSTQVTAFAKEHVPGYQPTPLKNKDLDWAVVGRQVDPSVVLIWKRSLGAKSAGQIAEIEFVEDAACMACNGVPKVKCTAEGCVNGKVTKVTYSSSSTKVGSKIQTTTVKKTHEEPCPVCKGLGYLACPECKGTGIDGDVLVRLVRAQKAKEVQVTATQPPASTTPPGHPGYGPRGPMRPGMGPPGMPGPPGTPGMAGGQAAPSAAALDPVVSKYVQDAIAAGRAQDVLPPGTGKRFRDVPAEGALLVGVRVMFADATKSRIVGIAGIYLTNSGIKSGSYFGSAEGESVAIDSSPGSAVAGIKVPAGGDITFLEVTSMRIAGKQFDTRGREGRKIGNSGDAQIRELGCDGSLAVGICGSVSEGAPAVLTSFGLVMAPPGP